MMSLAWYSIAAALLAAPGPGDLPRQASLGFVVDDAPAALTVRSVDPRSAAYGAGLRAGDRIVAIDGRTFRFPYEGRDLLRRLDGGQKVALRVGSSGKTIRFSPPPKPRERLEGFETEVGVLRTRDGARLRTYVSVPVGAARSAKRSPALFFVQWVSCSSIELSPGGATGDIMTSVTRALGLVLLRVERASNGDSEGPGCHALDFDTEVAHYREAFDRLTRHRKVDRSNVVVWGSSLGSVTAPFVVENKRIAGLVVGGGGALSYLERMITFDRIRLERDEGDPAEIDREMRRRVRFHYEYLLRGRDPQAIEAAEQDLKGVWGRILGTGDGVHYGRPYAYHRQAAAKNILGQWLRVKAPVLVMYNEYDQFEAEQGHRLIARTLNRRRPGQATYVRHQKMGHSYRIYADEYAAHRWDQTQRVSGAVVASRTLIDWLRSRVFRGR